MNNYTHLGAEERAVIMIERQRGTSLRKIADQLGRSTSTLSREIRRNHTAKQSYCATRGRKDYRKRRMFSVRPRKIATTPALCEEIEAHLINRKWSPEQISAILKDRYSKHYPMQVSPACARGI